VPAKAKPRKRAPNYSEAFRAAALAALDANGGNVRRTARAMGIRESTLRGWMTGRTPTDQGLRDQKRAEFDTVLEDFARRLCEVDPMDRKAPNLRDLGVALGIAVDKLLLLRGQPNAISKSESATATLDVAQLTRDELLTLLKLQDKASGRPQLPMAADLAHPVIVATDEEPAPDADE